MNDSQLDRLKDVIQDCNLNFLLGSGLSVSYIRTLGNIETLLTVVEKSSLSATESQVVRCSLYKLYFDDVMYRNRSILNNDPGDACASRVQQSSTHIERESAPKEEFAAWQRDQSVYHER
jgi:hypothetical protein